MNIVHYGIFLFFQLSDLVNTFTLIESVRYILDLWNEIYMCHSGLWLFKCSTVSESWCFFIQRNGSICIICGLTFTVHHCVNYMSFDCYFMFCEYSIFCTTCNTLSNVYMQHRKWYFLYQEMFISYETTILSVMIHYCTYSITKTLHLDLLVQTWVTRSQTVVCFHHASLSMTCMITDCCECSSGGKSDFISAFTND